MLTPVQAAAAVAQTSFCPTQGSVHVLCFMQLLQDAVMLITCSNEALMIAPACTTPDRLYTVSTQVKDPSLLRFMVDLRDADIDDKQLRDDLMTMLIAGHETTAAVLTWTLFQLMQAPEALAKAVQEIDQVIGDDTPSESLCNKGLRCCVSHFAMNPALML